MDEREKKQFYRATVICLGKCALFAAIFILIYVSGFYLLCQGIWNLECTHVFVFCRMVRQLNVLPFL